MTNTTSNETETQPAPQALTGEDSVHGLFGIWQPMGTAPKDKPILAAWGTNTSGCMGYDIVKHWRGEQWRSEVSDDRYPADAFHLRAWMPLPDMPNK